jgi:hypothetical protein
LTLEQIKQNEALAQQKLINAQLAVSFEPEVVAERFKLYLEWLAAMFNARDAYYYVVGINNWLLNYRAAGKDFFKTVQRVGYPPVPPPSWIVVGDTVEQIGPPIIDQVPIS